MSCTNLESELAALKQEWADRQAELVAAGSTQRPFIANRIKQLKHQLAAKQKELDICLAEQGTQPLETTFTGSVTLTTSYPSAAGPFTSPLTLGVFFGPGRTNLMITSFPLITTPPFNTPIGNNVTTVKLVDGGQGSYNSGDGMLGIQVTLLFDHSIDLPFYEEDSTLPLFLGTGSVGDLHGAPLDRATGKLNLVGEGVFQGGIMAGRTGRLVIAGTLADLP
jgi:hypothetical protein